MGLAGFGAMPPEARPLEGGVVGRTGAGCGAGPAAGFMGAGAAGFGAGAAAGFTATAGLGAGIMGVAAGVLATAGFRAAALRAAGFFAADLRVAVLRAAVLRAGAFFLALVFRAALLRALAAFLAAALPVLRTVRAALRAVLRTVRPVFRAPLRALALLAVRFFPLVFVAMASAPMLLCLPHSTAQTGAYLRESTLPLGPSLPSHIASQSFFRIIRRSTHRSRQKVAMRRFTLCEHESPSRLQLTAGWYRRHHWRLQSRRERPRLPCGGENQGRRNVP